MEPSISSPLDLVVPLVGVSADWTVLKANEPAGELLGRTPTALSGQSLPGLLEGADGPLQRAQAVLRAVAVKRADRRVYVDVWVGGEAGGAPTPAGDAGLPGASANVARGIARWVALVDVTASVAAEAELVRLRHRLNDSERARAKLSTLQEELNEPVPTGLGGEVMIGSSPALSRVREQIAKVAGTNTTVLIHGETGSGKELVARSVHALSPRKGQAFVPVNCGAIPETLIESEMFGHEKGAFTGADKRRIGKFELADGGTLFLDEIAELPLQSQAKLLRVLQDSTFERVGGTESVRVNVRLVAATHRDLARQVERGRFREDLYYRLNVFKVEVPPLRERKEDLRVLAEHLHERIARRMARPVLPLSDRSLRRLMAYDWPGNVRELANAIERATLLADGSALEVEIPEAPLVGGVTRRGGTGAGERGREGPGGGSDVLLDLSLEQLQRLQITHALERCDYRVFGPGGAAERLEINPRTLLSRMDKYGLVRPRAARRSRPAGESTSKPIDASESP